MNKFINFNTGIVCFQKNITAFYNLKVFSNIFWISGTQCLPLRALQVFPTFKLEIDLTVVQQINCFNVTENKSA